MNKRKSLSNSHSKSSSKKRRSLFINTNDYRNKKPSDILSPSVVDDFPVDHDFTIPPAEGRSAPKESTPARVPYNDGDVSVPKLNIHRKRGKTKHLSFSDAKDEKTKENEKENTLTRESVDAESSSSFSVNTNTKSVTSHSKVTTDDSVEHNEFS